LWLASHLRASAGSPAIHPYSKLRGILAKANKKAGRVLPASGFLSVFIEKRWFALEA